MARHKLSHRRKRARPPRKLLAWRKRARKKGWKIADAYGSTMPSFFYNDKFGRFKESVRIITEHQERKRAIKTEAA